MMEGITGSISVSGFVPMEGVLAAESCSVMAVKEDAEGAEVSRDASGEADTCLVG